MNTERIEGRIQHLLDKRKACELRLKGNGDEILPAVSPQSDRLAAKVAQIDVSLANFQKYGQETVPTGNPVGVSIDVPAGTFKIVEKAPGV